MQAPFSLYQISDVYHKKLTSFARAQIIHVCIHLFYMGRMSSIWKSLLLHEEDEVLSQKTILVRTMKKEYSSLLNTSPSE